MNWLLQESKLGLESVYLTLFTMTMLILGIVLSILSIGVIEYSVYGIYGITLFLFGLQMASLGKTPLGDIADSPLVFAAGFGISFIGVILCFSDTLLPIFVVKYSLVVFFGISGIVLLAQLLFNSSKLPLWKKSGDTLLMYLALFCALTYIFDIILALVIIFEDVIPLMFKAALALLFGLILAGLTIVRQKVLLKYPPPDPEIGKSIFTISILSIVLVAVYLILLGVLSILGSSINASAQLGLMMVIFAIQAVAIGSTPLGAFRRTHLVVAIGIVMAILGIIGIFVPNILDTTLTILIGLMNVFGAVLFFAKNLPNLKKASKPMTKIEKRIAVSSVLMNVFGFLFGLSMLIPIIPGIVLVIFLIIFGCIMLYLVSQMILSTKMAAQNN